MGRILKIVMLVGGILALAYMGSCTYANFFNKPDTSTYKMPEIKTAQYDVYVENTGNLLMTNSYDTYGKIIVLHGFWELVGREFKYRKTDLTLDQKIYGTITITKRVKAK
jgi:hypothetical protein